MRPFALALVAVLLVPIDQDPIDPSLRAAVEQFYATQEAEDAAAYLSLWSASAARPQSAQLKFIFDSGDDRFSGLTIQRVSLIGDRTVVRLSVTRERTSAAARRPDGTPMVFHTVMNVALSYVREGTEWKLVREGTPTDALADAIIAAPDAAERERLMAAEADLAGPALVSAVSRQADALAQIRNFARAQKLYELALDLAIQLHQPKLQADCLQNIGNALYYQRDFAGALRAFERRLAIERAENDDDGIASAQLGIATIRYSQFEYTDALAAYREALAIHERTDDTVAVAADLVNTGNVQFVEGDFAGAIADYRRSLSLYDKTVDRTGEGRALEGLGRTLAAQGDLAAALVAYSGVLDAARKYKDVGGQAGALSSVAEVHFRLGNLDTARGIFEQSRAQYESMRDAGNVGRLWHAIALTDLVSSRFVQAEQEYGRSSAACASIQDNDCIARAIVGLAFAQAAQQHFELAVASYRKAIAAFTALKKREDSARAELGLSQALAGTRDYQAAVATARHARDEGKALERDDVVWRALVAEARALRRLAQSDRAMEAATNAVATVERMASDSIDRPNETVPPDSVGAFALLAVLQAEAGDPKSAFVTIERQRSHAQRGALAANEREIARGMTADERDAERQSAAEIVTLRAQLNHSRGLPKPDAARIARLQQLLAAAVDKRRRQQQQVAARLPDLPLWRGLAAPATLDEAGAALRAEGDALAEFVIDDEDLLVVVLSRRAEGIECAAFKTAIARQALAEHVAAALDPAALRGVDTWRAAAAELVKALPSPALAAIAQASRLIVAPDDVLWRVPFEALPVEGGLLGDRTAVVYAGSATSLVRPPAVGPAPQDSTVLLVGTPDLPASTRDRVRTTSPEWTLPAPDGAPADVPAIASIFETPGVATLSGAGATEAAFRSRAPNASILHLAAPFRINGGSPLFSPLLLAGDPAAAGSPADNDGVLEVREIMNLDLRARIAVLADGGSAAAWGAAPSAGTVRWAWRAAGVPAIILSRWRVEAPPALSMLKEFYVRMRNGDTPEAALNGARAALRASADTRAPYFWAGWMIVGQ